MILQRDDTGRVPAIAPGNPDDQSPRVPADILLTASLRRALRRVGTFVLTPADQVESVFVTYR